MRTCYREEFLRFCLLFSLVGACVHGCGVTQHNLIAHKALEWFNPAEQVDKDFGVFLSILQQNQDAFQNGAAFPDWGYTCGESNASEMAHWPPFTLAYTEYFLNKCGNSPGNWNSDCQQLVAFAFGMVSHQVADVLWHDLAIVDKTQQGFIQAMANTDFGGSFSDAHNVADAGGEFIIAREFDLSFIQREWYLPAGDLSILYNKLGQNITEEKLIECNLLLYAEVHAVKLGGELLYPYSARRSAFLTDELLDYWMGGVDDNAVWTLWCWYDYLMSWLTASEGSITDYPLCLAQQPLFGQCPNVCAPRETVSPVFRSLSKHLINGTKSFQTKPHGTGVTFSHSDEFPNTFADTFHDFFELPSETRHRDIATKKFSVSESVLLPACDNLMDSLPLFTSNVSNSYLGYSFSSGDLNNDGIEDIVVGAPGWSSLGTAQVGGVYIMYGSVNASSVSNTMLSSAPTLTGANTHDRFGWASAVLDLNKDGWNDLIVSSPTYSAIDLTYRGSISVFWGTNGTLSASADLIIVSAANYTNLGSSFVTFDCDSDGYLDLLVAAPFAGSGTSFPQQKGKLFLLLSSDTVFTETTLNIEDIATWTLEGESSNNQFASQVVVKNNIGIGDPFVIVGSPMLGSGSHSSSELGKVYGYNLNHLMKGKSQQNSEIFAITGENLWDQAGFSFDVGSLAKYPLVLALSTPGRQTGFQEEQFGAVFFYDLTTLKGTTTLYGSTNLVVLQGDEKYARFGYQCVFDQMNSTNSSWWVTQPQRKFNEENPEAGAIFRWDGDKIPFTPRDPLMADECWGASLGKIRFGESIHFVDIDGNGNTDLFIGSPRWDKSLSGAFSVLFR